MGVRPLTIETSPSQVDLPEAETDGPGPPDASTPEAEGEIETVLAGDEARIDSAADFLTLGELRMTIIILIFALVSIGFFYLLQKHEKATPFTLRIFVIIILVFGTLLVVSSAYTTDQIAPIVGFFGTIAGYLMGRTEGEIGDNV